jgi:AcrR family transcriptional regulator
MPKIAAGTVAEHVAHQEAALVDAASRLFAERGVSNVTLADIAAEVGLARNSVYRYFPDKAHILAAWFAADLAPLLALCAEIAQRDEPAEQRLRDWMAVQLEALAAPRHRAMVSAVTEMASLPASVAEAIGDGHRRLYGTLATVVRARFDELGDSERDVRIVTMLVAGLLSSAAELLTGDADELLVRSEMFRAAAAIVDAT